MNRIAVDVPTGKMKAFDESILALGIERVTETNNHVPEWHKKMCLSGSKSTKMKREFHGNLFA